MKCDEMLKILSEFIDNESDTEQLKEIRAHLETCDHCQVVINSTQKTIEIFHHAGVHSIPQGRRTELLSRLKTALEQCKDNPPDLPVLG